MTTILSELAEKIDADKLVAAAETAPVPWAKRLGYLLKLVGAGDKASPLRAYVWKHARQSTALLTILPHEKSPRDENWKLYVNADVEAEL